jgi:ketopantoate reductase
MTETIEALNEFTVVEKPAEKRTYAGKFDKMFLALKNLANDKALSVPMSYIGSTKFPNWLMHIKTTAKKKFQMKVHAIQEHGVIKVFRR